jgi:ribonuclease HI
MIVDGERTILNGGETLTTNNRMELLGAIAALENAPPDRELILTVDSEYVKKGATEYLDNWKKRGWRTSTGKPVLNPDLWRRLDTALQNREPVTWLWVRGHKGHEYNELADKAAVAVRNRFASLLLSGKTSDA